MPSFSFLENHPIFKLAYQGRTNELAKYVNKDKLLASMKASNGSTPILFAVENGQLDTVKWLIEEGGAKANECDSEGRTALIYAASNGHLDIVKWLLKEGGSKITECSRFGMTAMIWAALRGKLDTVKWLAQKGGARLNERDRNGKTVLMYAAEYGHLEIMKWLLNIGPRIIWKLPLEIDWVEVKDSDRYGNTALLWAASKGRLDIVAWLLKVGGAKITERNRDGENVLIRAARYGHLDTVKWLLTEYGAKITEQDKNGHTALSWLDLNKQLDVIRFLLKQPGHLYRDILSLHDEFTNNDCPNETVEGYGSNGTIESVLEDHMDWMEQILEKENIVIPHENFCPITQGLILNPMSAPDGRVYEKEAIEKWLRNHNSSPITRQPIQLRELKYCSNTKRKIDTIIDKIETARDKHIRLDKMRIEVSGLMFNNSHLQSMDINVKAGNPELNTIVHDYYIGSSSVGFFKNNLHKEECEQGLPAPVAFQNSVSLSD